MSSNAAHFGAQYLSEPLNFPRRFDGERWGRRTLHLAVADERFVVHGLSEAQERTLLSLWPRFASSPGIDHVVSLKVLQAGSSAFRTIDVRNWGYDLDIEHGRSSVLMAGLDFMARIRLRPPLAGAFWTSTEDPRTFHGAFENVFRLLTAYSLLPRAGVLLHSAAVVEAGRAHLFIGHSGAGKSTVSRLARSRGRLVLSDDLNAVVVDAGGQAHVVGSPFIGELGARVATSYPLEGIFRLEKATVDEVRSMTHAETIASLLACAPFVNRDPHRVDELWRNVERLASSAPAGVLSFRREGTFWPLLYKGEVA